MNPFSFTSALVSSGIQRLQNGVNRIRGFRATQRGSVRSAPGERTDEGPQRFAAPRTGRRPGKRRLVLGVY